MCGQRMRSTWAQALAAALAADLPCDTHEWIREAPPAGDAAGRGASNEKYSLRRQKPAFQAFFGPAAGRPLFQPKRAGGWDFDAGAAGDV